MHRRNQRSLAGGAGQHLVSIARAETDVVGKGFRVTDIQPLFGANFFQLGPGSYRIYHLPVNSSSGYEPIRGIKQLVRLEKQFNLFPTSPPLSVVALGTKPSALGLMVDTSDLNHNSLQLPLSMRESVGRQAYLQQKNIYVLGEMGTCKASWSG